MNTKLKNLIATLLFLSCSATLFGQLIDENMYPFEGETTLCDMIMTSDHQLILCGTSENIIHILKLTTAGELIWSKNFNWNENIEVGAIAESIEGDYVIGGLFQEHPLVFRLDADGDSVVLNILPYGSENALWNISTVTCLPDGNLVLSQQINPPNGSPYANLYLCDEMGNVIVKLTDTNTRIEQVELLNDTTLLFAGNEFYWGDDRLIIQKVTTSGIPLNGAWYDNLLITGFDFDNLSIVYYSVVTLWPSYPNIIKGNYLGDILWQTNNFQGLTSSTRDIEIHDTIVFTTGGVEVNDTTRLYIAATDTNGQTLNIYYGAAYGYQQGEKIIIWEGKMLVAGSVLTENSNGKDLFLNRYVLNDLVTSITEPDQHNGYAITAYPIPANDVVFLQIGNILTTKTNLLKILDNTGRIMFSSNINGLNTRVEMIDVSYWPPGIYVAVVYSTGGARGKVKFVVR